MNREPPAHDPRGGSSQLVERATAGDRAAIESLLDRHLPALRGFVRLRMGDRLAARERVSDIVQSSCREVLEELPGFAWEGEPSFRKWLYTTALHKILQRSRHHAAERRDPAREAAPGPHRSNDVLDGLATLCTPSRVASAREEIARIERAFASLEPAAQDVVVSARIFGFSHKEIAEQLGKSEGAVRVLLHRALARLATS